MCLLLPVCPPGSGAFVAKLLRDSQGGRDQSGWEEGNESSSDSVEEVLLLTYFRAFWCQSLNCPPSDLGGSIRRKGVWCQAVEVGGTSRQTAILLVSYQSMVTSCV